MPDITEIDLGKFPEDKNMQQESYSRISNDMSPHSTSWLEKINSISWNNLEMQKFMDNQAKVRCQMSVMPILESRGFQDLFQGLKP